MLFQTCIINCLKTCIIVLGLFPFTKQITIIFLPVIVSFLNIHINYLLSNNSDIINCIIFKGIYDYITLFVQNNIFFNDIKIINDQLLLKLHLSKLKCGAIIPGINQKQYKELVDNSSKINEFLLIIPMLWSSIVSITISIYFMGQTNENNYPIRLLFLISCIVMYLILHYISKSLLNEKLKKPTNSITKFDDSSYVKLKLAMGYNMDINYEINNNQIDRKHEIRKYAVIIMNLIITYISQTNKNISQFHSFANISWMLSSLSDNIKSLMHYTYVNDFLKLTQCFENHALQTNNNTKDFNSVSFVNASFGYYEDLNKLIITQKITNLTYTFNSNMLYYLEAPNGIGKSTLLKMFTSNLLSGDVYFGSVNRNELSFEDISSKVFHIMQSSEYTPKLSGEEIMITIDSYKTRNNWLEERLGIKELLNNKDTIEMSGGQKKRIFIYIALISNAKILLLDEILSELSIEETPDVPEGGGWLSRVINTLVEYNNHNKIIIIVGHGLLELIPKKDNIINLKMENNNNTMLIDR